MKAVDGVSFALKEGEVLGIVGESGSGKSITCLSILGLVPKPAGRIVGGKILFRGEDLLAKDEQEMREFRGKKISIILQDPLTSLDPVFTIGDQIAEPIRFHQDSSKKRRLKEMVINLLNRVKIPSPQLRVESYPHQFSGGMRQRVGVAMAIASQPEIILADEPTTALDVTIQAQILKLLKEIQQESKASVILVTHDLGIVAEACDKVAVMYAGKIIEYREVKSLFKEPAHPYTEGLLKSVPKLGVKTKRLFAIQGQPPNLADLPTGCSFWPRCPKAGEICQKEFPPETEISEGEYVRCWFPNG